MYTGGWHRCSLRPENQGIIAAGHCIGFFSVMWSHLLDLLDPLSSRGVEDCQFLMSREPLQGNAALVLAAASWGDQHSVDVQDSDKLVEVRAVCCC